MRDVSAMPMKKNRLGERYTSKGGGYVYSGNRRISRFLVPEGKSINLCENWSVPNNSPRVLTASYAKLETVRGMILALNAKTLGTFWHSTFFYERVILLFQYYFRPNFFLTAGHCTVYNEANSFSRRQERGCFCAVRRFKGCVPNCSGCTR